MLVIKEGQVTLWGEAQHVIRYTDWCLKIITAGHGGFVITLNQSSLMPEYLYDIGTLWGGYLWFEEDCAWAALLMWSKELREADVRANGEFRKEYGCGGTTEALVLKLAQQTMLNCYPIAAAAHGIIAEVPNSV